jgi:predicted nucleic acid-binding protein
MAQVIIDTNIVSGIFAKQPIVLENAALYRRGGQRFLMSPVVYFEYRRSLLNRGRDSDGRATNFDRFVERECELINVDQGIAAKAAWIWSSFPGDRVPDADTLIAATGLAARLAVATRNRRHIERFGVEVQDWFERLAKTVRTRPVR